MTSNEWPPARLQAWIEEERPRMALERLEAIVGADARYRAACADVAAEERRARHLSPGAGRYGSYPFQRDEARQRRDDLRLLIIAETLIRGALILRRGAA